MTDDLLLGIDVGTTKCAAVIVSRDGRLLADASRPHEACLPSPPGFAEQDAEELLDVTWRVVRELPERLRQEIRGVGVAGQMHGVVVLDAEGRPLTPLVTWEDQRCLEGDFLKRLIARTGCRMRTGFGCSTLAWYIERGKLPLGATCACTIHDLVVSRLWGVNRPVTDTTGAASWGLFDLDALCWDRQAVKASGIPPQLLPEILPCGARAGGTSQETSERFSLPMDTPVIAAIGDNQASIHATVEDEDGDLVVNIGTGGQASAVLPRGSAPPALEDASKFDVRPFPEKQYVVVAPLLAGGSAWAWLAETVENWFRDLGAEPPSREEVYRALNRLGLAADDSLTLRPHFLAERYDASLKGSIAGIDLGNFSLGNVARALAKGLAWNLMDMLPDEALSGRRRIVGGGNALRRNPLLQKMLEHVFALPLVLADGREEAARGAAMLAGAPVARG